MEDNGGNSSSSNSSSSSTNSNSSSNSNNAAREDACREYQSSLEDLTFNSKPHINMLTILAEENVTFAKDIVAIIEAQISKVDENTRKSLFKLRSTWDEVFPLKKLYALDVRVNSLDPAWPIKPLPPTVNASIHVNPKFLKQSDEAPSPPSAPTSPPATPTPPAPVAPVAPPTVDPSCLTQEQMIRQQLLAKQKQLLELQQKKIELELEQTKAQLAGGFVLPTVTSAATPVASPPVLSTPSKPVVSQTTPVIRPWIPPQTQVDSKPSTRDPRLNRVGPPAPQPKEASAGKKDKQPAPSQIVTPEKRLLEKSPRPDKAKIPRRDMAEEKPASKSLSPMAKSVPNKPRPPEAELQKSADGTKKDPRLKKRTQDRPGDDEHKEKKRCGDKKEREEPPRSVSKGKMVNGVVVKPDREEDTVDKPEFKVGGNARTHSRKRTHSRSRSRSPAPSDKRKDRRSPKSRTRSNSPSPSHKAGKPRRVRADETSHGKPGRDDRPAPKKNQSDSRRSKRPAEERHAESRDQHAARSHDGGGKESKEAPHRWRSGWEENKHAKLSEEPHAKPAAPRHKPYNTPNRPTTPRTPKHRISVDANLQIPDVLNSASKKDLLRRASKRLESGEISQEDFLNMAHKIKHFFQYQEQQRTDTWEQPADFKKQQQPLLGAPAAHSRPHDAMNPAELSYYEHKSKLRKTQVNHRPPGEDWEGAESLEEGEGSAKSDKMQKYSRTPRDRPGERRSKEREDSRTPLAPMIEEYNHGKEFPTLKSLPDLRFRRRAGPRESSEREWNSPLTERQHYDDRDEHKSSYDAPRRFDSRHGDPRRADGPPPPSGSTVQRNCPSPAGLEAPPPCFERERLSPLHQKDPADLSPIPRFESPNSEHSDDGPLNLDVPAPHPAQPPKPILKGVPRGGPLSSVHPHADSPGHTPPHDGGHAPLRYNGPAHMGPSRPHPPGWFEGGGPGRYDETPFEGPNRFDGPAASHLSERAEGPDGPLMAHGPMRGGDGMGRFEGPHQGPGRFVGPMGQQPPVRFESQGPTQSHLEGGPMQRFDAPRHFNNMGPGSGSMGFQPRSVCFDAPSSQMGPMRFEGPNQSGPRYDLPIQGGHPRFEYTPGQQGPPRFGPQHNMPLRPMGPAIYDNPIAPQQNFPMGGPQRFTEPLNPQYPAAPMAFPAQQAGSFNIQPTPAFSQPAPGAFYNPAAPAVGMQQPVNLIGTMNQPFLPQNTVPFGQTPQVVPTDNHFGQVDVEDLLSKLISNGIIKPSQPDVAATPPPGAESSVAPVAPPQAEEDEEEEQEAEEDEDIPDLTGFSIDDMKQRYESVVTKLYSGNQCCLCSMRFTTTQTDMYADHLDWHFRQNHAGKVASKKVTHRRWYYSLTDWIEFEEIADLEERAKSQFFEKENEEEVQKSQAAAKEKEFQSVRATKDQVGELCEICQEPFETYWVEEEEDWFLKNAIKVDDKNFHPSCFEDYKNTSSYLDITPSPNKLLLDHPLGAFTKTEEEEDEDEEKGGAPCAAATPDAASVKQEDAEEPVELLKVKEEKLEEAPTTCLVKEEQAS